MKQAEDKHPVLKFISS